MKKALINLFHAAIAARVKCAAENDGTNADIIYARNIVSPDIINDCLKAGCLNWQINDICKAADKFYDKNDRFFFE